MSMINDTAATSRDVNPAVRVADTGGGERAAAAQLLRLMWGLHISRCVYAVAELGIPDLLADSSRSSEELAVGTGSDESSLYRGLRLRAALGVFEEHDGRTFRLSAVV